MAQIDKDRLYQELLVLPEQLGRVIALTEENVTLCRDINRELTIGRLKIDAARAACEGRTIA
jgi:hypothetical protein